MLPRKSKEFIKPTAEKLGYDEQLVEDVTSFFWKTLRGKLSKMENVSLMVNHFGVFTIKPWKLQAYLDKASNIIEYTKPDTFTKYAIIKNWEINKEKVENLVKQIEYFNEKKQSIKDKRNGKN